MLPPDKAQNWETFKSMSTAENEGKGDSVFVKPKARRGNIRKKASNDDEDDGEDVSKVIEETRMFQKYRAR